MPTLNQTLFNWIHHFSGRWVALDGLAIFFASWVPYILVAAFLVLVFYQPGARRKFYLFAEGAVAVILSRGVIATIIHTFYYHPRPFVFYSISPLISATATSSFPSGHATLFFALAMTTWYANRKWGWWFVAATTLTAIARIYAGVHWPLDVVAGAAIGILSAWFVHWLFKKTRRELVR